MLGLGARASGMDQARAPLNVLATDCREATARFLRGDPTDDTPCFEVMRRAICERDQEAWEFVVAQYRPIVLACVRQHPAFGMAREEEAYWVNRTFERFWSAVKPERFSQFQNLPALLKYLKLCAHSVLLDALRSQRANPAETGVKAPESDSAGPTVEALAVGRLAGHELWEVIKQELPDESERLAAYLSFALEMKPAEVARRHPDRYPTVADVYRVKRNVIERLRRSPRIQEFLR